MAKRNLEGEALKPFVKIAEPYGKKDGYDVTKGQGANNRIPLYSTDKPYFQFGDLKVKHNNHCIIVEVESSGGLTNLVKYWHILHHHPEIKSIILMHIYHQNSSNDYESHLELWKFMWSQMKKTSLGNKIKASCHAYRNSKELESIADKFKEHLENMS